MFRYVNFAAFLCILCLGTTVAFGQSADEVKRAMEAQNRVLESQNAYMKAERQERQEQYQRLSKEMEGYAAAFRQLQEDQAKLQKQIDALRQENANLKQQLVARDEDLAARIGAESAARIAGDKQLADAVAKQLDAVVKQVNAATSDAVRAANDAAAAAARSSNRATPPSNPTAGGGAHFIYEVAKGDTLSGIAGAAKVSVADIKTMNNLTSDNIWVGQKLKIPQK